MYFYMNFLEYIWLIPLFPLLGAAMMLFFGKKLDPQPPSELATAPGLEHTHHHGAPHDHPHDHSHNHDHSHGHEHHHGSSAKWLVSLLCPGMVFLSFIFSAG